MKVFDPLIPFFLFVLIVNCSNHPTANETSLGGHVDNNKNASLTPSTGSENKRLDGGVDIQNKPIEASRLKPHRSDNRSDPQISGSYPKEVDAYLNMVRAKILARWHCPPELAHRAQGGETQVKFVIKPTGHIDKLRLLKSSGVKSLDDAAVLNVRSVAPFSPVPRTYNRPLVYSCSFICSLSM